MSYPNLAESERLGIISLCNDLKQQGALHSTIEHIRELLTSRVSRLNDLAARVRELEQPAPVSATEPEPGVVQAWREDVKAYGHSHWSEEMVPMTLGDVRAAVQYIDTLRARVAELERVTEEQVERACSAYHGPTRWLEMAPNLRDTLRADMHNTLTAARGGG